MGMILSCALQLPAITLLLRPIKFHHHQIELRLSHLPQLKCAHELLRAHLCQRSEHRLLVMLYQTEVFLGQKQLIMCLFLIMIMCIMCPPISHGSTTR